ncbi:MAG: DUF2188 domain-containing protein [Polaromonas sp.]|uniref:DUF2188 domain-containing protein n=1 Tax=Polaromonas sp. TaxID=1869339 RepID=UPI00271FF83A|nr:DUF2188 domain-containing protein [Polaromonas sp.]MDO9113336.1 DUF2188 domain-containing protein [Polaromonas sp.]MDP1887897.1 DUF2188 domain-containing protein [Polaromonas sp.]
MSKPKDVHVVRHGEDWAARRPNTERVSKVFDTQQQAIDYGRQVAYGLVQAPRGFGLAAAHRDSDPSISELPVVQTGDVVSPERAWRLVAVLDKSALLVSLAADPAQRVFRIAPIEELRIVLSHRKAK